MVNERRNRLHSSTTTLASNSLQIPGPIISNTLSAQNSAQPRSSKAPESDFINVDPDSLFVKYSVSEVKAIQVKLKAEADAKQEELRLMVGERYRDLLQASTSIISMAESSKRVVDALYQMKKVTSSVQEYKPPRVADQGPEDNHLKILRSLAAHLKLLLDTPESLWRFLERKEYLNATWLFLLSGVVHRALKNENLAEIPWSKSGVNIQTQFPLAQRQWDLISQFRPQITQRATQFLKETSVSSDTICTTLLSLHLLKSQPLTETLSTLLSQRSRTLDSSLNDQLHTDLITSEEKLKAPSKRKILVNNLQKGLLDVIEVICGTIYIVRDIFQVDEASTHSMIERHLEGFQSSDPSKPLVTTSSLISTLPSSAHLLVLPRTILTYKPYIDLASSSTHVDPLVLDSKLSSWFEKALESFDGKIQNWLRELANINEVWSTRTKILDRLKTARRLKESEKTALQDVVDSGVRVRIIQLVSLGLENLENIVQRSLQKILQTVKDSSTRSPDADPSSLMFSPSELPSINDVEDSLAMSPFPRYKATMRHRIEGRTPFLLDIQQNIELQASEIRADMDIIQQSNDEAQTLQQQIMESYTESLLSSSLRLSEILEKFVQCELAPDEDHNLDVFIGRLCYHLLRSQFLQALQFASLSDQTLVHTLHRLQDQCIESWRAKAVLKALHAYEEMFATTDDQFDVSLPTQPSSCLMTALLTINSSLNDLGLPKHEIAARQVFKNLLASFGSAVAKNISVDNTMWYSKRLQVLWDMTLFLRLHPELIEENNLLVEKLRIAKAKLKSTPDDRVSDAISDLDRSTSAYLLRSQTLFGPLIDMPKHIPNGITTPKSNTFSKVKPTPLLRLGTPDLDQDYTPALGVAKPSNRFTMLSIGSTEGP